MSRSMKKFICLFLCTILIGSIVCGCGNDAKQNPENDVKKEDQQGAENIENEEIPEISISWGTALHVVMLEAPRNRVDEFKDKGIYLNPLSEDKFELIEDGKKLAILSYMPNKGASEVATLMGQGHLDSAICSNTGMLTAIDAGTDIKILCPVHTRGMGLVFSPDKDFNSWEDIKEYILSSEEPVKFGYHSPVSAPRLVLESVLKEEGLKVTEDPNDFEADVLLVDLKGTNNLIPSLASKQVDAWVGPSVFPETAEYKGLGKLVLRLEDFPPKGKWDNFPCCVFSAREEVLNKYPEVFKALVHLIDESCKYCMENKDDAAEIISEYIGVEKEIVSNTTINYTTEPTDEWLEGIKIYVDVLNKTNKFNGRLKGKPFDEVVKQAFDFSYVEEIKK